MNHWNKDRLMGEAAVYRTETLAKTTLQAIQTLIHMAGSSYGRTARHSTPAGGSI